LGYFEAKRRPTAAGRHDKPITAMILIIDLKADIKKHTLTRLAAGLAESCC